MTEFFMAELGKRFDTRQAAAFLTASGYATASATLNKLRCIGGGPAFEKFGRRPLYSESSLLQWVQSRTSHPLRSTSEVNTARPKRVLDRPRKSAVEMRARVSHDR
jgi:hypothetical protein